MFDGEGTNSFFAAVDGLVIVLVFLGAEAAASLGGSGDALEATVVVFEGAVLCFVCVVVVGFVEDVLAGELVSVVFFLTHDG